jgi:hypothetical protein
MSLGRRNLSPAQYRVLALIMQCEPVDDEPVEVLASLEDRCLIQGYTLTDRGRDALDYYHDRQEGIIRYGVRAQR